MINKADKIRKLLRQDKTTREIAHELRVSLRDIGLVRKQEDIDIGSLKCLKICLEEDIFALHCLLWEKQLLPVDTMASLGGFDPTTPWK